MHRRHMMQYSRVREHAKLMSTGIFPDTSSDKSLVLKVCWRWSIWVRRIHLKIEMSNHDPYRDNTQQTNITLTPSEITDDGESVASFTPKWFFIKILLSLRTRVGLAPLAMWVEHAQFRCRRIRMVIFCSLPSRLFHTQQFRADFLRVICYFWFEWWIFALHPLQLKIRIIRTLDHLVHHRTLLWVMKQFSHALHRFSLQKGYEYKNSNSLFSCCVFDPHGRSFDSRSHYRDLLLKRTILFLWYWGQLLFHTSSCTFRFAEIVYGGVLLLCVSYC